MGNRRPDGRDGRAVQLAIAAAKYPPTGNRSIGGGMANLNFAATSGDYFAHANAEILVILQTESPLGVENAEQIYALPGVDAIFIGPNDLQYRMRQADGTFPTPEEHESLVQRVIQVGRQVGTPTGIHTMSAEDAVRREEQGMQFLAIGSDMRFMALAAQQAIEQAKPDLKAQEITRY